MIKKFCAVFFLATALVIVGQVSRVEAAEVYVGSYSDGTAVYLLTQTVQGIPHGYECTVRASRDYLNYSFYLVNGSWKYSNSEGYSGYAYDGSSPVAANILNYVRNHH